MTKLAVDRSFKLAASFAFSPLLHFIHEFELVTDNLVKIRLLGEVVQGFEPVYLIYQVWRDSLQLFIAIY